MRIRSPTFRLRTSTSLASPPVNDGAGCNQAIGCDARLQASSGVSREEFTKIAMVKLRRLGRSAQDMRSRLSSTQSCRVHCHSPPPRPRRARTVPLLGQQLFQRGQQDQHVRLPAGVAHQADPPDLALERAEAGADFDAESLQQRLAHGRVIDARRNPHRVELRQRVARPAWRTRCRSPPARP